MKRARLGIFLVGSCIGIWLLLCAVIGIVAIEGALHPGRLPLTREDRSHARVIASRYRATFDEVAIAAGDQASLRAWSMRPSGWNGSEIILLHGQADNRAGMLGTADMLLRNGYAVLLPDARGHGESCSQISTYGVN